MVTIDETTRENFVQLFADNSEKEFQAALRHLGMFKPDDLYHQNERVSLTKLRMLLCELTGVLVLSQPVYGRSVICLCRRFWLATGQCSHELFVRWLRHDPAICLGDLKELTRGHGVQTFGGVDDRLRSGIVGARGRPAQVPSCSSLHTMEWLKNRARARSQARQQGSRIFCWASFI
jgi:hypothetical protein